MTTSNSQPQHTQLQGRWNHMLNNASVLSMFLLLSSLPSVSSTPTATTNTNDTPTLVLKREAEQPQKTAASSPQLSYAEVAGIASAVGGTVFLLLVGFTWWSCYGKAMREKRRAKKREEEAGIGHGTGTGAGAGARRESSPEIEIPERMRK